MGNISSNHNHKQKCFLCLKQINMKQHSIVECIHCNSVLHNYCEEVFRGTKNYCKCPKCQAIGSLGTGTLN